MACLSDSTSEEQSLSSYTSESFDDNGKTLMIKQLHDLLDLSCENFIVLLPLTVVPHVDIGFSEPRYS